VGKAGKYHCPVQTRLARLAAEPALPAEPAKGGQRGFGGQGGEWPVTCPPNPPKAGKAGLYRMAFGQHQANASDGGLVALPAKGFANLGGRSMRVRRASNGN
jgi:hypothetical protein